MTEHYLGLEDATVLETRYMELTRLAVKDTVKYLAMAAMYGPAGLGKTFAVQEAIADLTQPVLRLKFEMRPTMRLVSDRLLHALGEETSMTRTRFAMTMQLLERLAERERVVVVEEAQNLNRDCFEYLRYLHDARQTRFAIIFDGGDGCWDVICREPMLKSRILRPVPFWTLGTEDVLALMPQYHPILRNAAPSLIRHIDDHLARGRLRLWAAFTLTAADICRHLGLDTVNPQVAETAIVQLGG